MTNKGLVVSDVIMIITLACVGVDVLTVYLLRFFLLLTKFIRRTTVLTYLSLELVDEPAELGILETNDCEVVNQCLVLLKFLTD